MAADWEWKGLEDYLLETLTTRWHDADQLDLRLAAGEALGILIAEGITNPLHARVAEVVAMVEAAYGWQKTTATGGYKDGDFVHQPG